MKTSTMSDEVRDMIGVRHLAEQRGHFEPLGRLQWLRTEHGMIQFPAARKGRRVKSTVRQAPSRKAREGAHPRLFRFMSKTKLGYTPR